jgi:hypothetical protein
VLQAYRARKDRQAFKEQMVLLALLEHKV